MAVIPRAAILTFGLLYALAVPLRAQQPGRSQAAQPQAAQPQAARPQSTRALPVASLAGQSVAVLPLTLVAADSALKQDSLYAKYGDRRVMLTWADSTIGAALVERGPEVQWMLPAELRKAARRSPGMVKDPDRLGQAVLRSPRYKEVPEPLRAELRNLVAAAGGRVVLVPAVLGFSRDANGGGMRADLALVLVDARAGKVLWRAVASGSGSLPDTALQAALAALLPLDLPAP